GGVLPGELRTGACARTGGSKAVATMPIITRRTRLLRGMMIPSLASSAQMGGGGGTGIVRPARSAPTVLEYRAPGLVPPPSQPSWRRPAVEIRGIGPDMAQNGRTCHEPPSGIGGRLT